VHCTCTITSSYTKERAGEGEEVNTPHTITPIEKWRRKLSLGIGEVGRKITIGARS
jgi:hypothetical protein